MRIRIDQAEKAGYYITCLTEAIGWYYRAVYQGHTLKRTDQGWLLIVRVTMGGYKKVAFVAGVSIWDCFIQLGHGVRNQTLRFKDDLY